jgi:glycine/D-amino acid oxidase-like deaminating enzyme/nitrite reductase/ring-hydroxylating ferredoxin subunit
METEPQRFPSLDADASADIVVVGSGIAGLSTAYEAALGGARVIVVDRGPIGRGMTARTTAHLTSALDDFYHEFIPIRGEAIGKLHFASQAAAIARIDEIRSTERIDCDFKRMPAYLFLAGETEAKALHDEREALDIVGLEGSAVVDAPEISHRLSDGPCLVIPEQGRFHPMKYLDGLASACARRGAHIFADTCVTRVAEEPGGVRIETAGGFTVSADAVVVATNSPFNGARGIHAQQAPYRTYVLTARVPEGAIDDVLYWDTEDPYHYVRLHPAPDGPLLMVGGEDHRTGTVDDADERLRHLEEWARPRFPEMQEVVHRWSGQVMDTVDFAALIGLNPGDRRTYVVTGDSGQGITHGVVAGMMLPGLIADGTHPWAEVYAPERKPVRAGDEPFSAGEDVGKELAERAPPGDVPLPRGKGRVARQGSDLVAVCRDEGGTLHRLAAACTHAGCIIRWNSFEQCWDCPCHGSHFAPDGTALNAPAVKALPPADMAVADERRAGERV